MPSNRDGSKQARQAGVNACHVAVNHTVQLVASGCGGLGDGIQLATCAGTRTIMFINCCNQKMLAASSGIF